MIVDQAHRLHEGIRRRRTHETPPPSLELLTESVCLRTARAEWLPRRRQLGSRPRGGLVAPDEGSQRRNGRRVLLRALEKVVGETAGKVVMVKVDIDQNPGIAQAFRVQSIPMVVAFKGGQPVDAFMGAQGEAEVRAFVQKLLPTEEENTIADLIAAGDEASLRQVLELEPGNAEAIVALADLLVDAGQPDEALALLGRIPETDETRVVAAKARVDFAPDDDHDQTLGELLDRVKTDDDARQQFVDILELMGPNDPRTASYRKQLTARLF